MEQSITTRLSLDRARFETICQENGIKLQQDQADLLDRYVSDLLEWNTKINLISRSNSSTIWFSHILHSILPLVFAELPPGIRLLDLGSGGGLPGIPISILRPDISVTHVDSVAKKTTALQNMVSNLGLKNIVVNSRAEDLDRKSLFDHVIARAVAPLSDLIRWSRPLIRGNRKEGTRKDDSGRYIIQGPTLLALKGGDLDDEIQRARIKTGTSSVIVVHMTLRGSETPGLEDKRLLIVDL